MADTALSAGGTGSSGASNGGATEQAQEKAKEVAGQAQEQVRGRVSEQVDQRSTQAGEQVRGTAEDVRSFAQQLREQGKDKPAQYAEQAADRAERLGGYLQDADGDRILHDVEDFGRRNPWAVVAGGVALGLVASRMLKASSSQRYRSSMQGSGGGTQSLPAGGTTASGIGGGATGAAPAGTPGLAEDAVHSGTGTKPSQFQPHP
ncbi:MAG TPA: hypothetical protein VHF88_07905 [Thermoleophilaceae bacterium]|nr:hypothetical protein [Thermoleophilaceae bacterium]